MSLQTKIDLIRVLGVRIRLLVKLETGSTQKHPIDSTVESITSSKRREIHFGE